MLAFVMLMSNTMSQRTRSIRTIAVDTRAYFAPRQAAQSVSEVILEHPRTLQEVSRASGHLMVFSSLGPGSLHRRRRIRSSSAGRRAADLPRPVANSLQAAPRWTVIPETRGRKV